MLNNAEVKLEQAIKKTLSEISTPVSVVSTWPGDPFTFRHEFDVSTLWNHGFDVMPPGSSAVRFRLEFRLDPPAPWFVTLSTV